ncbi:hypothetical protein A4R26_10095 [Niastella populi]|uniref:Uncharacterized protein n=1 Tax=Niastella populi TaxID=550983 RepID=A0A1V9GBJ9_9BACT|nr:hypothetical protein A4R26_10095 [Niastella populi]
MGGAAQGRISVAPAMENSLYSLAFIEFFIAGRRAKKQEAEEPGKAALILRPEWSVMEPEWSRVDGILQKGGGAYGFVHGCRPLPF